jgi:hypothetical protein
VRVAYLTLQRGDKLRSHPPLSFRRLSVAREERDNQFDQWTLLTAVIVSEMGVPSSAWVSAFKRVNLHPKHRLPVDVWLSTIFEQICASAGAQVDDPHGPAYLRSIEIPDFYNELRDSDKSELLALTASPFEWTNQSMCNFPQNLKTRFSEKGNFARFFKYRNEMDVAVRLGLALTTDLTPAVGLARLHQNVFADSAMAKQRATLQNLQYIRTVPHLKDAFNSFYNESGEKTEKHSASLVQEAIGGLITDALIPHGGGDRPTHRHNQFGEPEGVACIVNDPARLLKLRQENNMRKAMHEHNDNKKALKAAKALTKKQKKGDRDAKATKERVFFDLLVAADVVAALAPFAKCKPVTMTLLKTYVKEQGITKLAPKKGGRPMLVKFFEELCRNLVSACCVVLLVRISTPRHPSCRRTTKAPSPTPQKRQARHLGTNRCGCTFAVCPPINLPKYTFPHTLTLFSG